MREYKLRHEGFKDSYIRNVYNDGTNMMVICFSSEMAKQFAVAEEIEFDMAFKRVHGTFNEFVIVTYSEVYRKRKYY